MPIKSIICDSCKTKTDDFVGGSDGIVKCRKCDLVGRAVKARDEYERKKKWLEETHLKTLEELKVNAEDLERQVSEAEQQRLVRQLNWNISNERTGECCTYSAAHGIPVTKKHVETSPKVLDWAGGDPIKVFQPNASAQPQRPSEAAQDSNQHENT